MKLVLRTFFVLFLFLFSITLRGATRSDTLDIRQTIIQLSITDFITKHISGHTALLVRSNMNGISQLHFDLQSLTVDSAMVNNNSVTFSQNANLVTVNPLSALNQNDSVWVTIYYHGMPPPDPTWGGFNYVGNYAFQIGVGFSSHPHSVGRTWHPCFDNMVERSPYEFYITTTDDKMAVCNGLLIDSIDNLNGTKTWHWKLEETIPSYLASVSVSKYILVKKTLISVQGPISFWVACEAADSNNVNASFIHMQETLTTFENHFGPYLFPRIGYNLAPFGGGAMEHASNITIGKSFIDGSLNYETLIAHELSHHWFGDLVTCSTEGDMWLNEGFASYCEYLFLEDLYGRSSYDDLMRNNHFVVVNNAHISDDGYHAVAGVDSTNTYGTTVYMKGADMLHTLRSYLGDSLFFNGLKGFLSLYQFTHVSTTMLKNYLTTYTGIDLNDFFLNWIQSPGLPEFSIDSTLIVPNGSDFDVTVFIRQRKHHSLHYLQHVPIELGMYNASWQYQLCKVDVSGQCTEYRIRLPFKPEMILLDPEEKISDAVTEDELNILSTGNTTLNFAKCKVFIKNLVQSSDSSLLRIAHHWVAPDRFKNMNNANGYVLNDKRYWRVDGLNLMNVSGLIQFQFNAGSGNSFLDSTWIKNSDDSIRLFYRKDATEEWQLANDSLVAGSPTDRFGNVYLREIKNGDYCFGIKRSNYLDTLQTEAGTSCHLSLSLHEDLPSLPFEVYPNPSSNIINFRHAEGVIKLYDMMGTLIKETSASQINVNHLPTGLYFIRCGRYSRKVVVD